MKTNTPVLGGAWFTNGKEAFDWNPTSNRCISLEGTVKNGCVIVVHSRLCLSHWILRQYQWAGQSRKPRVSDDHVNTWHIGWFQQYQLKMRASMSAGQ